MSFTAGLDAGHITNISKEELDALHREMNARAKRKKNISKAVLVGTTVSYTHLTLPTILLV